MQLQTIQRPMVIMGGAVPAKLYRLRWRFEFADKPAKWGSWDASSASAVTSAWIVNKTGLVYAVIEGEDVLTHETKELHREPGQNYASFVWEAFSKLPGFFKIAQVRPRANICGLSILTQDKKITVHANGTKTFRYLTDDEKLFKMHEHKLEGN